MLNRVRILELAGRKVLQTNQLLINRDVIQEWQSHRLCLMVQKIVHHFQPIGTHIGAIAAQFFLGSQNCLGRIEKRQEEEDPFASLASFPLKRLGQKVRLLGFAQSSDRS